MDSERDWMKFWAFVIMFVLGSIVAFVLIDNRQYQTMADKGFCYVRSQIPNSNSSWTWERCK